MCKLNRPDSRLDKGSSLRPNSMRRSQQLSYEELLVFYWSRHRVAIRLGLFFVDAVWNRPTVSLMVFADRPAGDLLLVILCAGVFVSGGWFPR